MTKPTKPGRKSAADLAIVPPSSPPSSARPGTVPAPSHLSEDATAWWNAVLADYDLEPHHLRLLQSAAEAWDRQQQARKALADHGGLTFVDQNGAIRSHPCVAHERDARIAFARLLRELDLDAGPPSETRRPPAIHSNRR